MIRTSRRLFLGASFAVLASFPLYAQGRAARNNDDEKNDPLPTKTVREDFAFQPSTLFLTWHKDPTTTMDVQWIGVRGETADTNIYYTADKIPVPVRGERASASKVNW